VFGRAMRLKEYACELANELKINPSWQIEVAAMLSQIGCVALPPPTSEKFYYGQPLSKDEQLMVDRLPELAEQLLGNIPRLEEVRAIVFNQNKRYDGMGHPANGLRAEDIPLGARIIKIVIDYDLLEARGHSPEMALDTMRGRSGCYDVRLLEAFGVLRGSKTQRFEIKDLPLAAVRVGMVFVEDVRTVMGTLLVPRGYEVTPSLVERIRNLATGSVREPVRVIIRIRNS
ncbi:MAG: two-component system response regulator, partial [Cyanobacteria bacterium NC_groundwater_1444_Ag_S-0.65um_54_12]|nr:two-component system response regulator [Cyanobacteria bacterium NC_groundwater_1444_Ag_S-0.65um_54_12]